MKINIISDNVYSLPALGQSLAGINRFHTVHRSATVIQGMTIYGEMEKAACLTLLTYKPSDTIST